MARRRRSVPPIPTTPPIPRLRRISRPRRIPPSSAQARAQRWAEILQGAGQAALGQWADVLAPTETEREIRDADRNPSSAMPYDSPTTPSYGRIMDPMAWWALERAHQGDDTLLLPYQPTKTTNPDRPRTIAAGYDKTTSTLRIRFRNGQVYGYYHVPQNVWRNFRRAKSPGRFINRVLNFYPYAPEHDLDIDTGRS